MTTRTIRPGRPVRRTGSIKGLLFFFLVGVLLFFWLREEPKTVLTPPAPYTTERYDDGDITEQDFQTFAEAKDYAGTRGAVKRSSDDRYVYLGGKGTGIVDDRGILSIHRDADLKKRLTYVASGTRVQLLDFGNETSRVSIAGVTGYVPSDRLRPFPAERVSNASYYQTKGDRLLHYIVADGGLGGLIVAGEANKTTSRTNAYVESKTLTRDLTKPTRLSAKQLDAFIKGQAPDSPLIGKGKVFKSVEKKYRVNAAYLLAHAIHESDYGRSEIAREKNNLFGVNATDSAPGEDATVYTSLTDSIQQTGRFIANDYLNRDGRYYRGAYLGNKQKGMNVFYASDPFWSEKIAGILVKMNAF
ncbi:N-acetylglucosaminidase [Exiguobacterium sp. TDN 0502]|uniref:N-acetylglucosaminidase n=1 Tax=Exiguobacterium sp. TDN 0502 TaxID=3420731 RepID=UPI003D77AF3B